MITVQQICQKMLNMSARLLSTRSSRTTSTKQMDISQISDDIDFNPNMESEVVQKASNLTNRNTKATPLLMQDLEDPNLLSSTNAVTLTPTSAIPNLETVLSTSTFVFSPCSTIAQRLESGYESYEDDTMGHKATTFQSFGNTR
mmetsp:Transcript_11740/g.20161  ORF Transcript_11740/g.20161 Transcript_11740/m.20161 type:complete len:144 (-) Transcript_11740:1827-2258(-)